MYKGLTKHYFFIILNCKLNIVINLVILKDWQKKFKRI